MTDSERKLWLFLKDRNVLGLKFRRQVPFGPYYLDFYCPEKKIAVELDGGQHYTKKGRMKDGRRDRYLLSKGIKILRYSDRDVLLRPEATWEDMRRILTLPSPLQGEGDKER